MKKTPASGPPDKDVPEISVAGSTCCITGGCNCSAIKGGEEHRQQGVEKREGHQSPPPPGAGFRGRALV